MNIQRIINVMLTRCVRWSCLFERRKTRSLTSVLRVEAIIHRRKSSSPPSRAAHRAEAFLSRGSAVENGHYVESRSNSGNKPKEKGSGRGRTSSGIDPEPRPFGPTNRPKDILKTTGRDPRPRFLTFRAVETPLDFACYALFQSKNYFEFSSSSPFFNKHFKLVVL